MIWKMIYAITTFLAKTLGVRFFKFISWFVCAWYFLFFSDRRKDSIRFYKNLFPGEKRLFYYRCSWKQYRNFTALFLDRFLHQSYGNITYTSEGWDNFIKAREDGTGGIILMSHMGNWDVAAQLFSKEKLELLIYMGKKQKEQMEDIHRNNLSASGVQLVAVDEDGGDPFDILEGVKFLKNGGFVSLTGDRAWKSDQRLVPVEFLGHEISLPESPFLFALLSGSPVFIFFSSRTSEQSYHFSCSEPYYLSVKSRKDRREKIKEVAQIYADHLAENVRKNPYEWYHFEPFLGRKLERDD